MELGKQLAGMVIDSVHRQHPDRKILENYKRKLYLFISWREWLLSLSWNNQTSWVSTIICGRIRAEPHRKQKMNIY